MPSARPPAVAAPPLAVACLALTACVSYRPGSLQATAAPGTAVVAAGCLDIAAAIADDVVAAWPVVSLEFGNRCNRPVPVDLRAVAAFAHTRSGAVIALAPYDPRGELRALPLEARSRGNELLQYRDRRDLAVVGADVVDVCLDLGGLAGGAAGGPMVRCFPRAPGEDAALAEAPHDEDAEVTP